MYTEILQWSVHRDISVILGGGGGGGGGTGPPTFPHYIATLLFPAIPVIQYYGVLSVSKVLIQNLCCQNVLELISEHVKVKKFPGEHASDLVDYAHHPTRSSECTLV